MIRFNRTLFAATATAVLALATMTPASAHGGGFDRHWGVGRGLVGAVVGLATLPLVVASAVIFGAEDEAREYRGPAYRDEGYAPAYVPPPVYYAPRASYYPVPPYDPAPLVYYAPRPAYYAPRPAYYSHESYDRGPRYYPAPGAYRAANSYRDPRPAYSASPAYRNSYRPDAYGYSRR